MFSKGIARSLCGLKPASSRPLLSAGFAPSRQCASPMRPRLSCVCPAKADPDDNDNILVRASVSAARSIVRTAVEFQRSSAVVLQALTPKAEGDVMDWVLMIGSTCVLVWLTMHLYGLYAWAYNASGMHTIAWHMSH